MDQLRYNPDEKEPLPFLDIECVASFLSVDDNASMLIVRPVGVPIWLSTVSALPILAFCSWLFIYNLMQSWLLLIIVLVAVPNYIFLIRFLNYCLEHKGDYFILDKTLRTLFLARMGITLAEKQILGFLDVHGWHVTRDKYGTGAVWMAELSVLCHEGSGEIFRYSVVAVSGDTKTVSRIGETLASFFGVEYRAIKRQRFPMIKSLYQCCLLRPFRFLKRMICRV